MASETSTPKLPNPANSSATRQGPQALQALAARVTKPAFRAHGFAETRIISQWPEIVGALLAEHSLPQQLRFPQGKRCDGVLTLKVSNVMALEFQHLTPQILERIATFFGYAAVARLRFVQVPLSAMRSEAALLSRKNNLRTSRRSAVTEADAADADGEQDPLTRALKRLGAAISAPPHRPPRRPQDG